MGKMYTLKPDESINDHVKESISLLNRLAEIVKEAYKYLPEKDCTLETGVFLDIDSRAFYSAIEHVRNSIEMLDELCDELEDDKDEIRQEYEEKVIQFFNRFMNADLTDETNYRAGELARLVHQLDNRVGELDQELEDAVLNRDANLKLYTAERERSNQLEKELSRLKAQYGEMQKELSNWKDLCRTWQEESAKDYKNSNKLKKRCEDLEHQLKEEHERYMKLREAKEQSPAYWKAQFERMQKRYSQLDKYCGELETEIDFLRSEDTDSVEVNNPRNFCGNCKHFVTHPNDVGTCNNKHADPFIVDPDDASCSHFESNQVDRDKPDQPCCKACNRDDCDDCTLCPF